jgi:hypothetical protein
MMMRLLNTLRITQELWAWWIQLIKTLQIRLRLPFQTDAFLQDSFL